MIMKKKFLSLFFCFIMLVSFCATAFATNDTSVNNTQNIQYFEDGSSLEVILREDNILTRGTVFYKSGGKTLIFRDNNGDKMWEVNFNVTFKVNQGVSATCTEAYFTAPTIYDSTWKYITSSTSKNGNKASGNITMKKYFMGLPIRTETPTVTVTCDNYGNLS